jgi:hypothetical protein
MIKVSPFTDRVEKSILYMIDQSIKVSLIPVGAEQSICLLVTRC